MSSLDQLPAPNARAAQVGSAPRQRRSRTDGRGLEASDDGRRPPPGWYACPSGEGQLRWWDGAAWSEVTRPSAELGGPAPQASRDPSVDFRQQRSGARVALVGVGVLGVLIGVASMWLLTEGFPNDGAVDTREGGLDEAEVQVRDLPEDRGAGSSGDDLGHESSADEGTPMAWDRLASELSGRDRGSLYFADLRQLEQAGLLDRSSDLGDDAEARRADFAEPLWEQTSGLGIPYLWETLLAMYFEWPSTGSILGFELGEVDRATSWGQAQALTLSDGAHSVTATLTGMDLWSEIETVGGAATWQISPDDLAGGVPYGIDRYADTIRVDDDLVVIAGEDTTEDVDPVFIELLTRVPDATFGEVLDPALLHLDGRPEPPGGYLEPMRAIAYTGTWQEGGFVHQLHLLMPDAEAAARNRDSLQTTFQAGGEFAEVLGQGSIEVRDRRVVITLGGEIDGSWADVRGRWAGDLGNVFATGG